jgi:hypothetical protein
MARTAEENLKLAKKYGSGSRGDGGGSRYSAVWGFRWEEPAQELIERKIFANPDVIMRQLRRRGLLLEISGKVPAYYVPHPEVIEESIANFKNRLRYERGRMELSPSAKSEVYEIEKMDAEFNRNLREVCSYRLEETVEFGSTISVTAIAKYLQEMFPHLYFDSLLSIVHQYSLADVEIVAPTGKVTNSTGFSLSFFGPTGSGKTFNIDDMIRGNQKFGIPPHGLPGRNRYCGGITPIQFIRLGEAYVGRKFNFIVPEFNDFFRYKGMVEPLKLVMEQREVKYETTEGTIGPYLFSSFFSVNYNTRVFGNSYIVTVSDPNFNAIEDRMLCRLHKMSKERFSAIDESRMKLELGELDFGLAGKLRDHMTLIYAIETKHPLLRGKYPYKQVAVNKGIYERFSRINQLILRELDRVMFSTRLGSRAIRLACAMSLIDYFRHGVKVIDVNKDAENFALRFYVEEVAARSQGRLPVEKIMSRAGIS